MNCSIYLLFNFNKEMWPRQHTYLAYIPTSFLSRGCHNHLKKKNRGKINDFLNFLENFSECIIYTDV